MLRICGALTARAIPAEGRAMSSLSDVAPAGDEVKTLQALRDRLAIDIDDCGSARDVAALSQRFVDVLKRISELQAQKPAASSPADEIAERRRRRRPIKNGATREA